MFTYEQSSNPFGLGLSLNGVPFVSTLFTLPANESRSITLKVTKGAATVYEYPRTLPSLHFDFKFV